MIRAEPTELKWDFGDEEPKVVTFTNPDLADWWLTVDSPAMIAYDRYFWGPISEQLITSQRKKNAATKIMLVVWPPLNQDKYLTDDVVCRFHDSAANVHEYRIHCRNDGPTKPIDPIDHDHSVPPAEGDLWLVDLLVNPPGNSNELSEYIVIENKSDSYLDLSGCRLTHISEQPEEIFLDFCKFARELTLKPHAKLSICTGTGRNDEGHLYLDQTTPIWNNTGDIIRLYLNNTSLDNVLLIQYGYGSWDAIESKYVDIGDFPQWSIIHEYSLDVGASQPVGSLWSVNSVDIQEDDFLVIETEDQKIRKNYPITHQTDGTVRNDYFTTASYLPSGTALVNGQVCNPTSADRNCPLPNEFAFGLIMQFKTDFDKLNKPLQEELRWVGAGALFTSSDLSGPGRLSLSFGINDSNCADNQGHFHITVKILRRTS